MPEHHVQVDVKFLSLRMDNGKKIQRFQYSAIDDVARIRALKIYEWHTQQNMIDFVDYIISKFPLQINTITNNGHEFQAKFHWRLEDMDVRHVYIKLRTPRLNDKVERS